MAKCRCHILLNSTRQPARYRQVPKVLAQLSQTVLTAAATVAGRTICLQRVYRGCIMLMRMRRMLRARAEKYVMDYDKTTGVPFYYNT